MHYTEGTMDTLTFISNIIEHLAMPSIVALFLLIFRESISTVIRSLKRVKYRDLEIELEETKVTDDGEVNTIISYLSRSAHSFQWFRDNTEFNYSDSEFNKIIDKHRDLFKPIKIVRRDKDGKKGREGSPGMKLTKEARDKLEV